MEKKRICSFSVGCVMQFRLKGGGGAVCKVLTADSMKMAVFSLAASCSLAEVY